MLRNLSDRSPLSSRPPDPALRCFFSAAKTIRIHPVQTAAVYMPPFFETAGHDKPQSRHLVLQMPLHPPVHGKYWLPSICPKQDSGKSCASTNPSLLKHPTPGQAPRSSGKAPSERQQLGLEQGCPPKNL